MMFALHLRFLDPLSLSFIIIIRGLWGWSLPNCLSSLASSDALARLRNVSKKKHALHWVTVTLKIAAHRQGYRVTALHMGNGWVTLQPCLCSGESKQRHFLNNLLLTHMGVILWWMEHPKRSEIIRGRCCCSTKFICGPCWLPAWVTAWCRRMVQGPYSHSCGLQHDLICSKNCLRS